jgi:hypothetical protein
MRRIVRPRVLAVIALALISLYALIGFFLVPYIIKAHVIPAAAERIKHPIEVREVALNPFTLSLRLKGLNVRETDQTPILGFEELFINLHGITLLFQKVAFDEIRLDMPFVSARMNREGTLNLLGLVPPPDEQAEGPAPETPADEPSKPIPVEIGLLEIDRGILEFRDESKRKAVAMDIVPINISLRNFSTVIGGENAYSFKAEIGKGEALAWEGTISLGPLVSDGKLSLSGVKVRTLYQAVEDRFQFDVLNGELAVSGSYHIDVKEQTPRITVKDGTVSIRRLAIGERGGAEPVVDIPAFDIEGVQFDLAKQEVRAAKVHSADARFVSWIDPDGVLNYQALFAPVEGPTGAREKPAPPEAGKKTMPQPWSVTRGEIGLRNYGATFEDRTLARPAHVDVDALDLTVKDVQVPFKHPLPVDLSLKLNKTGSVSVRGPVAVEPMTADLEVAFKHIDFRPFQPYLDRFLYGDVRDGALDLSGAVRYAKVHSKGPLLRFQGDIAVNQFSMTDRTEVNEVASWKSLAVKRLALEVEPTSVRIGEIVWEEPDVQVVLEADGRLNFEQLLAPPQPSQQQAVTKGAQDKQAPSKPAPPVSVAIDQVRLVKAATTFRDRSIEPNVRIKMAELSGTIKGLSSKQIAKADVALAGKVDGGAPVKISGQINPLSEDAYTDLAVKFDNLDLTAASPYAGKFAGYPIVNGKLFLDLKYKIAQKELVGENKVLIDQLTFGEKTDSPDATSLPVPLAVALLKDRNGKIDVDLPVRGNLNDPDFRYGRALLNVLLNLLAKAATSPLSLLGGLVGGSGDELQYIEFPPGQSSLSDSEVKKLGTLEKVLVERPGLFVEFAGTADPKRDRVVLAERKFAVELQKLKQQESGGGMTQPGAVIALSKEEEARLTGEWYARQFPDLAATPKPALPVEEQRERLVATLPVDEAELRQLAQDRATQIRARLLQAGAIPEERLAAREVQLKEESGTGVRTRLSLAGR